MLLYKKKKHIGTRMYSVCDKCIGSVEMQRGIGRLWWGGGVGLGGEGISKRPQAPRQRARFLA